MIIRLAILSGLIILYGCSAPENEQRQRIPDDTYRPSGFHAFITHGTGNEPISLIKEDTLYHLFYTTGTDEWGHLSSTNLLSWTPRVSFPIPKHGLGNVVLDKDNRSGLSAPWNILFKDGDQLNLRYSTDGNEWNDFEDNPVLTFKGAPNITWDNDRKQWILTSINGNEVSIYASQDLTDWQQKSSYSVENIANRASLIKVDKNWLMLTFGEKISYEPGTFDGVTFQSEGELLKLDGIKCTSGAFLNSSKELVLIARNAENNTQLPTFTTPLAVSYKNGILTLLPAPTFQKEIVGKRRAKLSKLFTDGPCWYNFVLDQKFEEMEIVVSDNTSDIRILWNKADQKILITGSALPQNKPEGQTIDAVFSAENLEVDLLIDHASVDLFFNQGEYATSILTLPATFFSKVEVYLDGEKYDAKGVLFDIGI